MAVRNILFALAVLVTATAASAAGVPDGPPPDTPEFRAAADAEAGAARFIYSGFVRWDGDRIRDFVRELRTIPEPAAAQALWLVASAPSRIDMVQVFATALGSSRPAIRALAGSMLSTQDSPDSRRLLMSQLAAESDPEVYRAVVAGLAGRSARQSVPNLIQAITLPGLRPEVASEVARHLNRLTRANLSDNPSHWAEWWVDNSYLYH